MKTNAQLLLSAAVAGIVGAGIVAGSPGQVRADTSDPDTAVKCYGINTCKGKGSCAILGFNTCKQQNSCKGKGFVIKKDEAACLAAKGSLVPPTPEPSASPVESASPNT